MEDEYLKPLGELNGDNMLVLTTISIPNGKIEDMTINLKGPIVINADSRLANQVIAINQEYEVKFPIYDILKSKIVRAHV